MKHVVGRGRRGFTLIELMVVIAIITVLIGLMVPVLGNIKESARSVKCQSNMRQMVIAATSYLQDHDGRYPIAYKNDSEASAIVTWEITTIYTMPSEGEMQSTYIPGELWDGFGTVEIQQCPSYQGPDNWTDAGYSGYNYNTSYIGEPQPVKEIQVKAPGYCALFGDAGYTGGANKFMRAPWKQGARDGSSLSTGRSAGTQAFRHKGATNVVFCDGQVRSITDRYTETESNEQDEIAPHTGFLSPDNSLYDLHSVSEY